MKLCQPKDLQICTQLVAEPQFWGKKSIYQHIVSPVAVPVGDYVNYTSATCYGTKLKATRQMSNTIKISIYLCRYINIHKYTYLHTQTYTDIHLYIHIYIHIHTEKIT